MGLGFAWYPEDTIRAELDSGALKPLPLREGAVRWAELYLIFADQDYAGRDERRLADILREAVARECKRAPERAAKDAPATRASSP